MNSLVKEFSDLTLERFLRYVRYWTSSDRSIEKTPSSEGQWELAKALMDELKALGINDITLTDNCYLVARIPASAGKEDSPVIGFLAHLDTSSDVSGKDVKPVLIESYDGRPINLNGGMVLDPSVDSGLASHKGKAIVHCDGTTLLGADDKAGIAAIMGAAEYLVNHPEIKRGAVEIIFTPDEETGKGLPHFPLSLLKSKACYTLDGGQLGELEIECFNAWGVNVEFTGKSMHLGTSRGTMVNAALMAAVYAGMLPRSESPESTDGYYGYYCPLEIQGDIEKAKLDVFIRDFKKDGAERRLAALESFGKAVEAQFPGGKVTLNAKIHYLNMKEKILLKPQVLEKLREAYVNLEIEIHEMPVRGGTDGACLTEMGIPTPNVFTGGRNYHSRLEWLSVEEMAAASSLVVELVKLWA